MRDPDPGLDGYGMAWQKIIATYAGSPADTDGGAKYNDGLNGNSSPNLSILIL